MYVHLGVIVACEHELKQEDMFFFISETELRSLRRSAHVAGIKTKKLF
jgi:hypothetical protein